MLLFALLFSFLLPIRPTLAVLPDPDPFPIQPFFPSSPPSTIPAFPEQSDLSGCPLELSDDLFPAINHACGKVNNSQLSKDRCCPVLATWLYSAYSGTALGRAGRLPATPYDLPVLPDDSETCVENLEKALRGKGIELLRPNETCDVVYCYCGIRLHVPICTGAFGVSDDGRVVGDERVRMLERECSGGSGVGGCTKCLKSLNQLNGGSNGSESERKKKMHDRDCELMGVTWLLAKNRSVYIPTVSAVLTAIMTGGGNGSNSSDALSCSLSRDGMPLAVDSDELDNPSPSCSTAVRFSVHLILILLTFYSLCISFLSHPLSLL